MPRNLLYLRNWPDKNRTRHKSQMLVFLINLCPILLSRLIVHKIGAEPDLFPVGVSVTKIGSSVSTSLTFKIVVMHSSSEAISETTGNSANKAITRIVTFFMMMLVLIFANLQHQYRISAKNQFSFCSNFEF